MAAIVFWRRKRAATASWSTELADLSQNCLVTLDAVVAEGSVVTGRVQALAAEARALETRAPDEASRREAGQLRAGLDGLVDSLEADRRLRFAVTTAQPDQLAYSTDLIRQQITQLQGILRPRDPAQPPYGTTLYGYPPARGAATAASPMIPPSNQSEGFAAADSVSRSLITPASTACLLTRSAAASVRSSCSRNVFRTTATTPDGPGAASPRSVP